MAATEDVGSIEESLAWEAEQRPRAGAAAILAGVLLLGSFIVSALAFSDSPSVTLTDGFRDVVGQPPADGEKGLLTASAQWIDSHGAGVILVTAASAVGTVLIAFALGYLFRALQARRPETSRAILIAALVGPILYGIGPLIRVVGAVVTAGNYVSDGVFSTPGAHEALRTGAAIGVGQGFGELGRLATAVAIVFLALYAMRVGLLTRFLGVLGVIVGVLLVLPPLFGPPVVIQSFWLVALGLLFLHKLRSTPPTWETGVPTPWPSQQELREARDTGAAPVPVAATPGGSVAVGERTAHPASKKRKRKRR